MEEWNPPYHYFWKRKSLSHWHPLHWCSCLAPQAADWRVIPQQRLAFQVFLGDAKQNSKSTGPEGFVTLRTCQKKTQINLKHVHSSHFSKAEIHGIHERASCLATPSAFKGKQITETPHQVMLTLKIWKGATFTDPFILSPVWRSPVWRPLTGIPASGFFRMKTTRAFLMKRPKAFGFFPRKMPKKLSSGCQDLGRSRTKHQQSLSKS